MATTFEYGQCPQCNENNPKSLAFCRSCGTGLPWAKAAAKPSAPGSGGGFNMGDIAWGPMAVQMVGGVIFCAGVFFWFGNVLGFFRTFPFCGYLTMLVGGAIWRGASGGS